MATAEPGFGASLAAGLEARRQVLGTDHVDASMASASSLGQTWLAHAHTHAWGGVWTRDGLDQRTRITITFALMIALGRDREITLYTRAAMRAGLTPQEIVEVVIHTSIYVGFPAAHEAFALVESTLRDLGELE
jgi:alkylhydroperoxidase/carboxymuconolactone decarboxylase family protein YurZ